MFRHREADQALPFCDIRKYFNQRYYSIKKIIWIDIINNKILLKDAPVVSSRPKRSDKITNTSLKEETRNRLEDYERGAQRKQR